MWKITKFIILILFAINMQNNTLKAKGANNQSINQINSQIFNQNFWLKQKSNKIILNTEDIVKFNKKNFNNKEIRLYDFHNIYDYSTKYDYDNFVLDKITKTDNFEFLELKGEFLNLNNISKNNFAYAVSIQKHNLRNIPQIEPYFLEKGDTHFDKIQDTSINFGEPFIILHYSKNKKWAFGLIKNSFGWVKTKYLAFTNQNSFEKYLDIDKRNFITNISKGTKIINQTIDMGVIFEILEEDDEYYTIKFPTKDKTNNLILKKMLIKKSDKKFYRGYLPYTKQNVVKQAFKYLGTDYGWGNLYGGIDCSGLLLNIYRTFGFNFPRNSSKQKDLGHSKNVKNYNIVKKKKILNKYDILYMKGHIMLYLGEYNNNYYILHSLGSYYIDNIKQNVMEVVITDTNLMRKSGETFLESISYMNTIK